MAPVICGLDLKEVQWSKFKNSNMWHSKYHLRRTKFIIYPCAVIFCVVSESLGNDALDDYIHSQRLVAQRDPKVYAFNNDCVGATAYNVFVVAFITTTFSAAFFSDLFWPERHESKSVQLAWKICGVLACLFHIAGSLWLTIITARDCGYFMGADRAYGESLLSQLRKDGGTPLCYRYNARTVAAVVFGWIGFPFVVISCVLLWHSTDHNSRCDPKSSQAYEAEENADHISDRPPPSPSSSSIPSDPNKNSTIPKPAAGIDGSTDYTPPAAVPHHTVYPPRNPPE